MNRLASVLALGVLGCVEQPSLSSTAGVSFEELRATAHREAGTNAYVVDGDIVLHNDDALYDYWARMQQGALAVYSIGGVDIKWTDAQKVNLTYCVGGGFSAANKTAILAAMTQATDNGWMKFANVKFIHVAAQDGAACTAGNNAVMFDINQVVGEPYLARAFFPDQPRVERNVLVDTTSFTTQSFPLANIIAHELGHTLGFRHEHTRPEAGNVGTQCDEGTDFRGLTPYDKGSVMHYPQCNGFAASVLAFTTADEAGVKALYGESTAVNPAPMAMINSPTNGAVVPPTFTVMTSLIDTDLVKGELYIDQQQYKVSTSGPYNFEVTNLAEGGHALTVRATDSRGQYVDQVINVTVMKPAPPKMEEPEDEGTCNSGGSSTGFGLLVVFGLVGLLRRRR